jgi:phosphoribosylaminoimidazolecarboxamide formyltransferase/IMP cyclohydrolase
MRHDAGLALPFVTTVNHLFAADHTALKLRSGLACARLSGPADHRRRRCSLSPRAARTRAPSFRRHASMDLGQPSDTKTEDSLGKDKAEKGLQKIRRALVSVSDKASLREFAQFLVGHNVEIISTGGTAEKLRGYDVPVIDVSEYTGFPEILDGRVKTLVPKIHGGILGVRGNASHEEAMKLHSIEYIDLVVVNLYPFEETVRNDGSYEACIENIDIGGPTLIRAAAKNHASVTVVTDVHQYSDVMADMNDHDGCTTLSLRKRLAAVAFSLCASYDSSIAAWFMEGLGKPFPDRVTISGRLKQRLRYGENPHQPAAFYMDMRGTICPGAATAEQVQGKELSYNNILDTDAAFRLVSEFTEPACAIIKHSNPCGCATGVSTEDAYLRALACDPISAFGGIVALNRKIDKAVAEQITKAFTEVVIAPDASAEALEVLSEKKATRVLLTGAMPDPRAQLQSFRSVMGGFLVQALDTKMVTTEELKIVTKRTPTENEMRDLLFAWKVCKHVKSNAIVYARDGATVGIGAGQMSRVDASRIAAWKAQEASRQAEEDTSRTAGSVVASDAFFPFVDGLVAAADAGATAVIQPGGSKRDAEVIAAADERGIAMVFTGIRHFLH